MRLPRLRAVPFVSPALLPSSLTPGHQLCVSAPLSRGRRGRCQRRDGRGHAARRAGRRCRRRSGRRRQRVAAARRRCRAAAPARADRAASRAQQPGRARGPARPRQRAPPPLWAPGHGQGAQCRSARTARRRRRRSCGGRRLVERTRTAAAHRWARGQGTDTAWRPPARGRRVDRRCIRLSARAALNAPAGSRRSAAGRRCTRRVSARAALSLRLTSCPYGAQRRSAIQSVPTACLRADPDHSLHATTCCECLMNTGAALASRHPGAYSCDDGRRKGAPWQRSTKRPQPPIELTRHRGRLCLRAASCRGQLAGRSHAKQPCPPAGYGTLGGAREA